MWLLCPVTFIQFRPVTWLQLQELGNHFIPSSSNTIQSIRMHSLSIHPPVKELLKVKSRTFDIYYGGNTHGQSVGVCGYKCFLNISRQLKQYLILNVFLISYQFEIYRHIMKSRLRGCIPIPQYFFIFLQDKNMFSKIFCLYQIAISSKMLYITNILRLKISYKIKLLVQICINRINSFISN